MRRGATRMLLERAAPGLYHCVNSGACTWLELAAELRGGLGVRIADADADVRCEDARDPAAVLRAVEREARRRRASRCRTGRTRSPGPFAGAPRRWRPHQVADRQARGQPGRIDAGRLNRNGLRRSRRIMKSANDSSGGCSFARMPLPASRRSSGATLPAASALRLDELLERRVRSRSRPSGPETAWSGRARPARPSSARGARRGRGPTDAGSGYTSAAIRRRFDGDEFRVIAATRIDRERLAAQQRRHVVRVQARGVHDDSCVDRSRARCGARFHRSRSPRRRAASPAGTHTPASVHDRSSAWTSPRHRRCRSSGDHRAAAACTAGSRACDEARSTSSSPSTPFASPWRMSASSARNSSSSCATISLPHLTCGTSCVAQNS